MRNFSGPIPGQSLTTPPKGFPWERPPEIVDPEEAIQMHLARISDPEMLEGILDLIELDNLDLKTITNGIMRGAVSQGMHSIDVALLVAPVVHEFIKQGAIAFGLSPEDGFEDKEEKAGYKKARDTELAKKMIKEMGKAPQRAAKEVQTISAAEQVSTGKPKGLMSRGEV
jgi:hypothetical protein